MKKLICLILLAACTTTKSQNVIEKPADAESIMASRWAFEPTKLEQDLQGSKLKVEYESYFEFLSDRVRKTVTCYFREPVQRTLIATAEAPIEISGNTLKITKDAFEKQEFKQTLAPKSGVGPNKTRSAFCHSEIKSGTYIFSAENDELILKPLEETLKLKKYIQK